MTAAWRDARSVAEFVADSDRLYGNNTARIPSTARMDSEDEM